MGLEKGLKVVRFIVFVGDTALAKLGTLVVAKDLRAMSRTCTKLLRSWSKLWILYHSHRAKKGHCWE